jgi:hypothetical protein
MLRVRGKFVISTLSAELPGKKQDSNRPVWCNQIKIEINQSESFKAVNAKQNVT